MIIGLTLVTGCAAAEHGEDDPELKTAAFSTSPRESNHEDITTTALAFLKPEVLAALVAGNVSTDIQFVLDSASHFDDCNFSGGSALVATRQAEAVQALDPSVPVVEGDALAILSFARSLHGVQDFYAHSNWVELGGAELVDASLTPFPLLSPYSTVPSSGFVVVQGTPPTKAVLQRPTDAAYPKYAVVTLRGSRHRPYGLVSGTVDYEAGNFCPTPVAMTHTELNKDSSTEPGRTAQHEAAKTLAIMQTQHEWCRLNQLALDAWGEQGQQRLASWVLDPAAAPDCTAE